MLYWNLYRNIHIMKENFALTKSIIHKRDIDLSMIDLQKRRGMLVLEVTQLQKIHEKVVSTLGVSFLFCILFIIIVSSSSMPSSSLIYYMACLLWTWVQIKIIYLYLRSMEITLKKFRFGENISKFLIIQ